MRELYASICGSGALLTHAFVSMCWETEYGNIVVHFGKYSFCRLFHVKELRIADASLLLRRSSETAALGA